MWFQTLGFALYVVTKWAQGTFQQKALPHSIMGNFPPPPPRNNEMELGSFPFIHTSYLSSKVTSTQRFSHI